MSTIECSCRLCPTPGIYVVTSIPLVRRTRATLRSAEFGFFGVCVYTRVQTPRFCGHCCRAGLAVLYFGADRPLPTNSLTVGPVILLLQRAHGHASAGSRLGTGRVQTGHTSPHVERLGDFCSKLRFTLATVASRPGPGDAPFRPPDLHTLPGSCSDPYGGR